MQLVREQLLLLLLAIPIVANSLLTDGRLQRVPQHSRPQADFVMAGNREDKLASGQVAVYISGTYTQQRRYKVPSCPRDILLNSILLSLIGIRNFPHTNISTTGSQLTQFKRVFPKKLIVTQQISPALWNPKISIVTRLDGRKIGV
jgi:hypothetical protein